MNADINNTKTLMKIRSALDFPAHQTLQTDEMACENYSLEIDKRTERQQKANMKMSNNLTMDLPET